MSSPGEFCVRELPGDDATTETKNFVQLRRHMNNCYNNESIVIPKPSCLEEGLVSVYQLCRGG